MHTDAKFPKARPLALAALVAGPAVTLAGMATTNWEPESTSASYLQTLAATPTRSQVAALLLIFGYALMGLAAAMVLRHAGRAPKALRVATGVLAFCGATLLPGAVSVDFTHLALAETLPLDQAVAVMERSESYGLAGLGMLPGIAGLLLGAIGAAACAWRARLVGVGVPVLAVAGLAPPFVLGFGALSMVGASALTLAAYALIARGVARHGATGATRAASAPVAAPRPVVAA